MRGPEGRSSKVSPARKGGGSIRRRSERRRRGTKPGVAPYVSLGRSRETCSFLYQAANLAQSRLNLIEPVGWFEDLAGLRAVGGADDSVALHHVDQGRRAAIAYAQAPLQQGSGGLAEFQDQPYRVLE